ncbi:MAG: CrcB family protein [Halobacteriaceae archaeon]
MSAPWQAYGFVALGGGTGAVLRAVVGWIVPGSAGTLLVNVAGALLLGLVGTAVLERGQLSRPGRLVATSGLLSSFTTYSTFMIETALAPGWPLLLANVAATYGFGLGAALAGRVLGRSLLGEVADP